MSKAYDIPNYVFLFGLTNDAFGYMLTKDGFNSFKKDMITSAGTSSLGEMTGRDLYRTGIKIS